MEPKEQIRERIDVADLVGEYLQLKTAGQGSWKAVCPFHAEKTPSFYVSRPKQIWHCFGCDKGSDIFSFVMEMEGVDFREALEILGGKAGVEIPKYNNQAGDDRSRLKQANEFAEAVYRKVLGASAGSEARAYLQKRGIDDGLVELFGIGYAPSGWSSLVDLAKKKQISAKDLLDGGLALNSKKGSGAIDRFRNRLMIPLCDNHGNGVELTGRVLDPNDSPKYMNSPQTAIYDKSALLYGLHLAKTASKHAGEMIVVEGNLDVVASHKAGVEHVVASSGTALTERQLALLKRYTSRLIFSFDTDAAGFAAARRGMRLASSMGFDVRVVQIPPELGKDPDDLVQKDPALWQKVVKEHVGKMEFFFNRLVLNVDMKDVAAKKMAGKEFLPEVKALADPIEQEHWARRFADHLGVSLDAVKKALRGTKGAAKPPAPPRDAQQASEPAEPTVKHDPHLDLLFSLCFEDESSLKALFERVKEEQLPEGPYRLLYKTMSTLYTANNLSPQTKSFFEVLRSECSQLQPQFVSFVDAIALAREQYLDQSTPPSGDTQSNSSHLIDRLIDQSRKAQRKALLAELRRAEAQQDAARISELTQQLQSLIS